MDFSPILRWQTLSCSKKIHGRLELLALANSRTQQGDSRLYDFVLNRSQKQGK